MGLTVRISFLCETPLWEEADRVGAGPRRARRCALCSCGAIRTINFTPIEDLKAGTEGGRGGVGGLAGEGIYLHTEVCTLQVTVLLSCLAYSAFKTMLSRLSFLSELDFTP